MFRHALQFGPDNFRWSLIPAQSGVFALFGADDQAEPYISRTPNLRNRLRRLLDARPDQTKRLRLAESTARIEYSLAGSEFEARLLLYRASVAAFGERARKRLHLRSPVMLRMTMENAYPRVYVTGRITEKAARNLFGPWPSRAAAEEFLEAMLDLFLLRRCVPNLHPDSAFPGCIYSEMKKCLAPCFKGCTDERYAEEARAVHAFLATGGASRAAELGRRRDAASAALDFERAAEIHADIHRVESAAARMPAAVRALDAFSGVVMQPASEPGSVALFLLDEGRIIGPAPFSTAGMRCQNEQSGSTSLFAQPVAVAPVPLGETGAAAVTLAAPDELEARLDRVLSELHELARSNVGGVRETADHLSLFGRWCYRPQNKRVGEVCFVDPDGRLPRKALLRAISRVCAACAWEASPMKGMATAGPHLAGAQ